METATPIPDATTSERDRQKFAPRARFCGTLDWSCPFCGHLNRERVDRTTWRVQCRGKCRRRFAIGTVLRTMAAVQSTARPPIPPPDVVFPLAVFDKWRSGEPVNLLIEGDTENAIEYQETVS